jgi:thioredoxin reductase
MKRRTFIKHGSMALIASTTTSWTMTMNDHRTFDVVIIGGSYSGLSAALSLARARRSVLIIDAGQPCNASVRHSHNLLTHDGEAPHILRAKARADVSRYPTVQFHEGLAGQATGTNGAFTVRTSDGREHHGRKLLLALGVRDVLPEIPGLADCWGISAAACPFCHGYEVGDQRLIVLGNAPDTIHYARLIHNWSERLWVCTNGPSSLDPEQVLALRQMGVTVNETPLKEVVHEQGQVHHVVFTDGSTQDADTLFLRAPTVIPTTLADGLGLERTEHGLFKVDHLQRTNVAGVYASGDCTSPMRSLSTAIASGTIAGASIVHDLIYQ